MDLATWLIAQYDADERGAGDLHDVRFCAVSEYDPKDCDCGNPTLVLADLAAKRRIVEQYRAAVIDDDTETDHERGWSTFAVRDALEQTVRLLALPYAGRESYDPAWAPSG